MVLKNNRIFYLDEIRALAILLILLAHTIQYFPIGLIYTHSPTLLQYLSVARLGVPLFFILSGALLLNKDYTLTDFYKKRFSRVLIPLIFWKLIKLVIFLIYNNFDFNLLIIWFNDNPIEWFILAIIGVYLVMPIFNSFIKEYGMAGARYAIAVWLVLIILNNFKMVDFYGFDLIFGNFGKFIGYAVLGYYLANYDFNIYALPMTIFNLIIFIVLFALHLYYASTYIIAFNIDSLSIIIECSALFLAFRYFNKFAQYNPSNVLSKFHNIMKKSVIGSVIYNLSICSYAIYLMHIMVINILLEYYPITTFNLLPVSYILLVLGSFGITYLLSKIPVINRLAGIY